MPTCVRSFCKINLGLAVGPARPDGFHGLTTAYQTLALHDLVTVTAHRAPATEITLEADHPGVPCTAAGNCDRNTAYKMVAGALRALELTAEVHLQIEKRLPVQGGLGAGSANAAAALLGLERELGIALPGPGRLALAAEVGSDVPLFLLGGTVLGLNRGESVFPLPDSPALPVVVAIPSVGVSTAQAFRDLDAQMDAGQSHRITPDLTGSSPADRLEQLSRVLASVWTHTGSGRETTGIANPFSLQGSLQESRASESPQRDTSDLAENPLLALVRTGVENDFESVAFRQHPSLRDLKCALAGSSEHGTSQALYAALSGSGSALFGIYGSPEAAREAQQRVQSLGTRALLTETLPRHEYWGRMFA
ncbi:MAG TPA: hypothetical protein VKV02_10380 [Acidobacteriaceae bacterium]|nr:hypothetical protein [Acidobacteriaceae bacterium]